MKTIDFSRSFLTFRVDYIKKPPKMASHKPPYTLNNARIPIDCVCEINEKQTSFSETFVLGVSCKTERVGVDRDIWSQPNADFVPVASQHQFLVLKAFDIVDKGIMLYPPSLGKQPERQLERVEDVFDSLRIDIAPIEGEILDTPKQIVNAVLTNHILTARTKIETARYVALLEYPIKTINANERDLIYQPDTGPILYPDLSREPEDLLGGMELAFIAFNTPTWAELILRVPTPIADELSVYHYSQSIRIETTNQIIRR
jgi:hypothetical protein